MKNLEDIARFEGKAEGKIEGKAEGKYEATLEIARNMKKSNISLEVITQLTGLNAEDINKL
jgi:predicted transposase/invertase (TIGR01784 family)